MRPGREPPPYPKADPTLRGLARLADLTIAVALATTAPVLGALAAAAYLLTADALFQGQSVGKRIFGVRAVVLERRVPAGLVESVLRNAPFGLLAATGAAPLLWPVLLFAALPLVALEAWRAVDDPLGRRYADLVAGTQVVDAKVLARGDAPVHDLSATPAPPAGTARLGERPTLRLRPAA